MTKLKIGCTLQNGKYEIIKVLGSGNFGITYLASTKIEVKGQIGQMDVSINVAIKEFYMKDLNNRMSDGTTVEGTQNTMVKNYRQKFKKEAENLAKLHHSNIVKVIEVFDENNTTYYVMEYVEGGSLDEYIKSKGHLQEDEALKCTLEIANALSYMHQNRMVHLDLKPKNIMRNSKGHLYLIDFGLSKQYDENGEPESSTSIGLGTPGYAPLEQASYKQDGTLPATLDVYALGASLYKMLTGKTPPESSAILNEGFPLTLLQKEGISSQTISIVEKAMSSAKKDRYQSVDSMSKAISNITDESDQMTFAEEECGTTYDEEINVVDVDATKKESVVKSTTQSVPTYIDTIKSSRSSKKGGSSSPTLYIIIGVLFIIVLLLGFYFFSGNSKHVTIMEKDGKFGLGVDGKTIVECQYDSIFDSDMYGITPQRYLLFKDGKKGIADTLGNIILPCKYMIKQSINGYHVFEENHKQGVIDSVGNIVIDNKYNDVNIVEYDRGGYSKKIELLFIVKDENGLCGIVNNAEQVLSPIKYKEIKHLWGFYYIDTKGRWSYSQSPYGGSSAYYKHIYDMDFLNGFRAIVVDFSNKFGVISLNGTEIIKCQYDDAVLLGISHVLVKDTSTSEWKCINKDYQVQFSITCDSVKPYIGKVIVYDKGKKKLLDESGTLEPFKL